MIKGITVILLFQGLGELVAQLTAFFVPGPVVGLILFLAALLLIKKCPPEVEQISAVLLSYFGLLFVPAAVGVLLYASDVLEHAVELIVILAVSTALTILVTAFVLRIWFVRDAKTEDKHD